MLRIVLMAKEIHITKASGESVKFSEHKLIVSLQRAGASKEQIETILNAIANKLFEGISTKQIYRIAFRILKENSKRVASKYHLKRAIMELGPSGYPFEHYVGEIFRSQGYETKVGVIVQGQCVKHEIDVIAEKGKQLLMVECKYHNQQGIFCDVKIPLYINSRFLDVQSNWKQLPDTKSKIFEGWLVTNTHFTSDAIQYGTCAGLKLLGWDYPPNTGLKDIIDEKGLYPITCISSLTKNEKRELLDNKIVLCQELYSNPKFLERLRIKQNRIEKIVEETKELCNFLVKENVSTKHQLKPMQTGKEEITIQFLGAVGTVTGSKYYIRTPNKTILVDCGLFQGIKDLRLLNWKKLPVTESKIDLVLLTHGHLDHSGYLPRLVKEGFKGQIWGSKPTLEIAKIILEDSAHIQEEDADRANKERFSKHHPAKPLYGTLDVEQTVPLFKTQLIDQWIDIDKDIQCRFRYSGHIIGSTFIELRVGTKIIVFSGDLGRKGDLLMYPSEKPTEADVVLIESTYGNRFHEANSEQRLAAIINNSIKHEGTIIIPSFAVERSQMLMYLLWQLRKKGTIPNIPIYMDSPMGANVLDVFLNNIKWHKLPISDCKEMCKDITIVSTPQETNRLIATSKTKIVIAGSGMATGGRVLSYMAHYLGDPNATILFVGYQAEGTRGRTLIDGADDVKLYGKYFKVRAKIENLSGMSSHADQNGLIDWLSELQLKPEHIFIVHGEKDSAIALQSRIKDMYGWESEIPQLNQSYSIEL